MRSVLPAIVLFLLTASAVLGQTDFRNGDWLAYVLKGDVWVQAFPNGAPQQVSHGGNAASPSWTNSQQLSFVQSGRKELIPGGPDPDLVDRDLVERAVRTIPQATVRQYKRSPDGKQLAVVVETDPYRSHSPAQLYVIHSDGTQSRLRFTPSEWADLELAGWTADSRNVLFWIDTDFSASIAADGLPLMSIPADDGKAVQLSREVLTYEDFVITSPLNPEVLLIDGGDREAWTNKRLVLSDPVTGKSAPLTGTTMAVAAAAWSPDAQYIAYTTAPDDGQLVTRTRNGVSRQFRTSGDFKTLSLRRLWIMNADGTGKRQLTHDANYRDEHPAWSSDGRYIVFTRFGPADMAGVWSIEVSSGTISKIVERIDSPTSGFYGHPNWASFVGWIAQ